MAPNVIDVAPNRFSEPRTCLTRKRHGTVPCQRGRSNGLHLRTSPPRGQHPTTQYFEIGGTSRFTTRRLVCRPIPARHGSRSPAHACRRPLGNLLHQENDSAWSTPGAANPQVKEPSALFMTEASKTPRAPIEITQPRASHNTARPDPARPQWPDATRTLLSPKAWWS